MIANSPAAWSQRADTAATSHEAAMWSEHGQQARFEAVLAALDPRPGERLLDYGCGTGALSEMIPAGVGYLGVDWSPGMLERARREHPTRAFAPTLPPRRYDCTAVIGPFNLRDNWSEQHTWAAIMRLWMTTGRALAVSLYRGSDESCISYQLDDLLALRRLLAPELGRIEKPLANDYLLVLRRY